MRVTPSFRLRRSLPKKHNDHKTYKILHFQAPDTLRATQGLYNITPTTVTNLHPQAHAIGQTICYPPAQSHSIGLTCSYEYTGYSYERRPMTGPVSGIGTQTPPSAVMSQRQRPSPEDESNGVRSLRSNYYPTTYLPQLYTVTYENALRS